MSEPGATNETVGDRFERIYNHLKEIAAEVAEIHRTQILIMSGCDLNTVVDIGRDERDLEQDLRRLEKQLRAHVE